MSLTLQSALAIAENTVQIGFSGAVYWSGLLDMQDASQPSLFTIAPVAGTVGSDGNPARAVTVTASNLSSADQDAPAGSTPGAFLDLTLDRPLSPYPAQYTVSVAGVYSADLSTAITTPNSQGFFGTYRQILQPTLDAPTPTRDFSNPQSFAGAAALANPYGAVLGVFPVDQSGDYATDSGLIAYKKRIYRRLVTRPGAFLHMPGYGVGIPQAGKTLSQSAKLAQLAAQAEKQILQEPETAVVSVTVTVDPSNLGLVFFNVGARTKTGSNVKFAASFPTVS